MHMVGGMVQRRQPAHGNVCLVHQFVRQPEYRLDGLRIQKKPEQAEREHGNDPRELPFFEVEQQHYEYHQQRVQEHQQEYRFHADVGCAHFQRFYQGWQSNGLPRAGIAQNGCGLRPHVADKALPHADEGGGNEDKRKVDKSGQDDIHRLSHEPCFAVNAHQVKWRAAGDERHISKEQQQKERGKQNGIAVSKGPHKGFHELHGGIVFLGELHRLIRKQKAQHEGQAEGDNDAGVFVPLAEVVFRYGKDPFQLHMRSSLLFAAYAKARAMSTLNSISSTATPTLPNIQREEGLSHSRGYSTNSLLK